MNIQDNLSPWERMQQERKRREELSKKLDEWCLKEGIIFAQLSPRRYSVLKINGRCGVWPGHRTGKVVLTADTLLKSGSWTECMIFLTEECNEVPAELRER